MPDLLFGLMPSDHQRAFLFGPEPPRTRAEGDEFDAYARKLKNNKGDEGKSTQSLLQFILNKNAVYGIGSDAQVGGALEYRITASDFTAAKGMTVRELVKRKTPVGTFANGHAVIYWMCGLSGNFSFRFPGQLPLYNALAALERENLVLTHPAKGLFAVKISVEAKKRHTKFIDEDDWAVDAAALAEANAAGQHNMSESETAALQRAKARADDRFDKLNISIEKLAAQGGGNGDDDDDDDDGSSEDSDSSDDDGIGPDLYVMDQEVQAYVMEELKTVKTVDDLRKLPNPFIGGENAYLAMERKSSSVLVFARATRFCFAQLP